MRTYNSSEVDEILSRHRDADRGMTCLVMGMCAASGFIAAVCLFGLARFFGWW